MPGTLQVEAELRGAFGRFVEAGVEAVDVHQHVAVGRVERAEEVRDVAREGVFAEHGGRVEREPVVHAGEQASPQRRAQFARADGSSGCARCACRSAGGRRARSRSPAPGCADRAACGWCRTTPDSRCRRTRRGSRRSARASSARLLRRPARRPRFARPATRGRGGCRRRCGSHGGLLRGGWRRTREQGHDRQSRPHAHEQRTTGAHATTPRLAPLASADGTARQRPRNAWAPRGTLARSMEQRHHATRSTCSVSSPRRTRCTPHVTAELAAGAKTSHWMWFIFPQLQGPGAQRHRAALRHRRRWPRRRRTAQHPLLGARLRQCGELLMAVQGRSALQMFGSIDALKLRSCLTLFERAGPTSRCSARC